MLRDMFKKTYTLIDTKYRSQARQEPNVPEGLWRKCRKCGEPIYGEDVKNNYYICPKCKAYFRVHAMRRIEITADRGTFREWNREMEFSNPLDFPGYEEKVQAAREKTKLNEAVVTGQCLIQGEKAAVAVCDARFLMSSMGHVVGEKITLMVERATREGLPVIIFACSGGARMQEGCVSLMQMAKTSGAIKRHHQAGNLFVSVLTDPTTGGVTASFAMLGDIILAEPGALIGFAGPRVIQQTIGQKLPEGFQKAEFLVEHGFVDRIVPREEMKETLGRILKMHARSGQEAEAGLKGEINVETILSGVETAAGAVDKSENELSQGGKTAWDHVQLSRKSDRPVAGDYIEEIFDEFMELRGDRYFGDDGAIIGGIAMFHGTPVTVIGQQKGKTTKENISRNFGMPSPEGYRKALRLMKQAEKFGRPVICFVDTPGAFCGIEAEERGQGEAIARSLFEMSDLKVPILSIVIGEGGSGGALALAVANEVWMLENAVYSVLSPEGFASILWKDSKRADEAAEVMKVTAKDLLKLGIIEDLIPEKTPASGDNLGEIAMEMDKRIGNFLGKYGKMSSEELQAHRYERFRRI